MLVCATKQSAYCICAEWLLKLTCCLLVAYRGFAKVADVGHFGKLQYMVLEDMLTKVQPLMTKQRVKCNTGLTAPGVCVDTRNTKSVAYFVAAWDAAKLNLYSRGKGGGSVIDEFTYTEGINLYTYGQVDSWRYLMDGWYETHFLPNL